MSDKSLAALYRQLSSLLEAGVPIVRALDTLGRQQGGSVAKICHRLRDGIQDGKNFTDAATPLAPGTIPVLHLKLFAPAERSGRLPEVLTDLATALEGAQRLRQEIISRLIYPGLIFHLAALINGVLSWFTAGEAAAVRTILGILLPLYAVVGLGLLAWRARLYVPLWKSCLDHVMYYLPIVGGFTRNIGRARFSRTLANLYSAGVSMIEGVGLAAEACGNRVQEAKFRKAITAMQAGDHLWEALLATGAFTPTEEGLLTTGAETGKLDDMLRRVCASAEFDAQTSLDRIGRVVPVLIYLVVMGIIVVQILSLAAGYTQQLSTLTNDGE